MFKTFVQCSVLIFATCTLGFGQDLAGVKCLIDGKAQVSPDAKVEYRDGTVYFCCDQCAAKFKERMKDGDEMLAMKANHQLVLTGQYVQSVCPITGRDISEDKTVEIGGVTVGLCCAGCLKKVDKQEGLAAKAQLVFADKPFEKGFERKIEEVNLAELNCLFQDQKDVNPDMFAEYNGHRVYFCCPECKADFEKDPSAHTAEANHQLAESGQVKQVACPFSGGDVAENQSSEIDGVTVKFCCKNCKAKMDQADEEQQMEYAFGEKGFKRAFAKNE